MTTPPNENNPGGPPPAPPAPAGKRLRVGQVVTFRHPDPTTGDSLEGHGLVVRVPSDPEAAVTIAPLSLLHLWVHPDNVAASKAEAVPVLNEPEPDEASAS